MSTHRKLTWSYGGGRNSVAIMVLIAQGKLPKPEYIGIADTGREKSSTWEYTQEVISPLAKRLGLEIDIIPHTYSTVDLFSHKGKILMPVFTRTGQARTFCSSEWKKYVFRRRLRELGYSPKNPVTTWIGISSDEFLRMKPSGVKWQEYEWPLVYDVPLTNNECVQLVKDFGLPEPPKSSCYMCPFISDAEWLDIRDNYPEDFQKAIEVETKLRQKEDVFVFWSGILLSDIQNIPTPDFNATVTELRRKSKSRMDKLEVCDSGYCFV